MDVGRAARLFVLRSFIMIARWMQTISDRTQTTTRVLRVFFTARISINMHEHRPLSTGKIDNDHTSSRTDSINSKVNCDRTTAAARAAEKRRRVTWEDDVDLVESKSVQHKRPAELIEDHDAEIARRRARRAQIVAQHAVYAVVPTSPAIDLPSACEPPDATQREPGRQNVIGDITRLRSPPATMLQKPVYAQDVACSDAGAELDDMFADPPSDPKLADDTTLGRTIVSKLDGHVVDSWSDPDGYYRVVVGEILDARYYVQAILGKGVYSSVVRALDRTCEQVVAIKIIRDNDVMKRAAQKEVNLLRELAQADPDARRHIVQLSRTFVHRRHTCMVLENMDLNLRDVLRKFGKNVGINIQAVRSYARQIFLALSLLHQCHIIHADLKPDNILVDESHAKLKICDLGSATSASENELSPYHDTRFYLAPEIILGCSHDTSIDTWSVGCTLFELYAGVVLFPGNDNNHMLLLIQQCRGRLPKSMSQKGAFAAQHFDVDSGVFVAKAFGAGAELQRHMAAPSRQSSSIRARLATIAIADPSASALDQEGVRHLSDLLERCLELDPTRRIRPEDALAHPFLRWRGSRT